MVGCESRSVVAVEGVMRITNLRIVWYASSMPRINLSIGYSNITGLQSREVASVGYIPSLFLNRI